MQMRIKTILSLKYFINLIEPYAAIVQNGNIIDNVNLGSLFGKNVKNK